MVGQPNIEFRKLASDVLAAEGAVIACPHRKRCLPKSPVPQRLTPGQHSCFEAVKQEMAQRGRSPSIGELAHALDRHESTVDRQLNALKARGLIRRPPLARHNIQLIQEQRVAQ